MCNQLGNQSKKEQKKVDTKRKRNRIVEVYVNT